MTPSRLALWLAGAVAGVSLATAASCTDAYDADAERRDAAAPDGTTDPDGANGPDGQRTDATLDTPGADAGDGGRDAGEGDASADGAGGCRPSPRQCLDAMEICAANCEQSYDICMKSPCAAPPQECPGICKRGVEGCQGPCIVDCAACASGAGSCTGTPDCSARAFRPATD